MNIPWRRKHLHWSSVDADYPQYIMEYMEEPGFELISFQPHEYQIDTDDQIMPKGWRALTPVSWLLVWRSYKNDERP